MKRIDTMWVLRYYIGRESMFTYAISYETVGNEFRFNSRNHDLGNNPYRYSVVLL